MAHELTIRENGKAEIAFVGKLPWHGLGQSLDAGASIEQWQKAAGMDWEALRSAVSYTSLAGKAAAMPASVVWPENHVIYRSDSGTPLGIVSDKYEIVQPGEILEFFRDIAEANLYQLETAGTLFGGKRFWALAKIADFTIGQSDAMKTYLLLSTSVDGSLATTARHTSVRVVCNNTLSMAFGAGKPEVKIRHSTKFDAESIKRQLGCGRDATLQLQKQAKKLASVSVNLETADDFIVALLRKNADDNAADSARDSRAYKQIIDLFSGQGAGSKLDTSAETAWGLVNAVTDYVDHYAFAKNNDKRFDNALYGMGAALKDKAFSLATML